MIIENDTLRDVTNDNIPLNGTYEVPKGVIYIGKLAFFNCSKLKRLIIPEGVTCIGEYAFRSCINLKEVEIPSSVKSIRGSSFAIPDFNSLKSPLTTVIVTPDRNIDDKFKSYFPSKVKLVVKNNEKTNNGRGGK